MLRPHFLPHQAGAVFSFLPMATDRLYLKHIRELTHWELSLACLLSHCVPVLRPDPCSGLEARSMFQSWGPIHVTIPLHSLSLITTFCLLFTRLWVYGVGSHLCCTGTHYKSISCSPVLVLSSAGWWCSGVVSVIAILFRPLSFHYTGFCDDLHADTHFL